MVQRQYARAGGTDRHRQRSTRDDRGLLAAAAKYGKAHVKRAYGNWTGTSLKGSMIQRWPRRICRYHFRAGTSPIAR